jgi:hypothetical protein
MGTPASHEAVRIGGVTKPLLLLDVDGVLAIQPAASLGGVEHHTVRSAAGDTHAITIRPEHGSWIRRLARRFDIVWATGWEHDAPRLLGPLLGIPDFDVATFTERPSFRRRLDKLPDVRLLAVDRPTAWVDDDLDDEARSWAHRRTTPTLLIQPDPAHGLTARHVQQLLDFAEPERTCPLKFSIAPRCHGACGSQNQTSRS